MKLSLPIRYNPILSIHETQEAIKYIKNSFENRLSEEFNLTRVSASMFVLTDSGLNDNLSGSERPVRFDVPAVGGDVEIVHSLAKWKRMTLKKYGFSIGEGLYTDMNAIRRDEVLDNLHSIYVDQWDWERVISREERTMETLTRAAGQIFCIFKGLETDLTKSFDGFEYCLPMNLTVISTQELLDEYPNLSVKEREDAVCREYKAVFLTQIGDVLSNGESHGSRAPDYDDWTMNGDLIWYHPVLDCALEISSMGIRVDSMALKSQMKKAGLEKDLILPYHQSVLNVELPYTIGGGIGQSRMSMFLLGKKHIGEVQSSIWSREIIEKCEREGIPLL
jgi:aspartate--ammonia ligase